MALVPQYCFFFFFFIKEHLFVTYIEECKDSDHDIYIITQFVHSKRGPHDELVRFCYNIHQN